MDGEGKASNNPGLIKTGAKAMGVLIVTGGSRGIGAEISRLAGAHGWSVRHRTGIVDRYDKGEDRTWADRP